MDGHVHVHPCYDRGRFLGAASANFRTAAERAGLPPDTPGVLMLTESAGVDAFAELAAAAGTEAAPGWLVSETAETISLALTRSGSGWVYVVAGRQIVTRERLEVLALGVREHLAGGRPLDETTALVREAGGLPVIPWGFGKWTGRRGRRVAEFLRSQAGDGVLLGDNGGRLDLAPVPALLREARRSGRPVVPGSDPLPFASHTGHVARYGFVLTAGLDRSRPARTVIQYLASRKDQPCPFGRLTPLPAFLISQLRMQLRSR